MLFDNLRTTDGLVAVPTAYSNKFSSCCNVFHLRASKGIAAVEGLRFWSYAAPKTCGFALRES